MRRMLLAAVVCLLAADAGAEIVRVEFEGRLTSVEEGFPVTLADDEAIRGGYLIDTGTYVHISSDVVGEIEFQAVRSFTLLGSSDWELTGRGQTTSTADRESTSTGLNTVSILQPIYVVTASHLETSDGPPEFQYQLPFPSGPITLSVTTPPVADYFAPWPYVEGVGGTLAVRLEDNAGQTRAATFEITRLAVVPEPSAVLLALAFACVPLRRRR